MDVKLEYMKPGEIEARSFEIIRQELEVRGIRPDPEKRSEEHTSELQSR